MQSLNQVERELVRIAERVGLGETTGNEHDEADELLENALLVAADETEDEAQARRIAVLYRRATGREPGPERPLPLPTEPDTAGIPIEPE